MFEDADDVVVVDAIGAAARAQSAACGRELEAIGELYARRAPDDDVERLNWAIDGHDSLVAEVSAELRISRGRAGSRVRYAIALRERLPAVLDVLKAGAIDFRVMAEIVSRTENVEDPELMARIDAAAARQAPKWTSLSGVKLEEAIDWLVSRVDPAAVRTPPDKTENRFIDIGPGPAPGLASLFGTVLAPDAVAFDTRLDQLADTVCAGDPRTTAQRRADAVAALVAGADRLPCQCGNTDCVGAGKPLTDIVIHVLAEQATLTGTSQTPGYLPGLGPIPATMMRDLAKKAKLKPVVIPTGTAEKGYRPSTALASFVRWRDLGCRFPGCDKKAMVCDLDHTRPWPFGATHPSNVKPYCRHHHLIKTFHTGVYGWSDKQHPDGTVTVTAPSGKTYTTKPGGGLFFPILTRPTGIAPQSAKPADDDAPYRGVMMPRRERTRVQNRKQRITAERTATAARLANEKVAYEKWLETQPPPEPAPF